jgi:RNase P subunit RPR2
MGSDKDFEIIKQQIREKFGEGRKSAIVRPNDITYRVLFCKHCETELAGTTAKMLFIGSVIFHGRVEFNCSQCGHKFRWYPNLDKKTLDPIQGT